MHVEIEDIVEAGDRVVVTFRQRFKGKGSEIEVKVKSFNVFTVRDTRIVRMALFTGRDAALDAARVESSKVEIVREPFDAYAREDFDSLVALLHPEVELHEWPEGPDSRVYHGPDGIMHAREEWAKAWEYIRAEPLDFVEAGDRVFVPLHSTGKGRGSSIEVELETFGVYTLRDSKGGEGPVLHGP